MQASTEGWRRWLQKVLMYSKLPAFAAARIGPLSQAGHASATQ
jgi:hypothetical protein